MINNYDEEKIFFTPGDLCTLKQDIPNKPIMIVQRIERSLMRNGAGKEYLRGVRTRWFTKEGLLQEALFSTKDLILIKND